MPTTGFFHSEGQETGGYHGHDGSHQEVAGQPREAIPIVVITPDGGFVMCGFCYVSCSLDCTGH